MNDDREVWPNFFLAGVPKAGTTSLYEYLGQHPQIYLSPIKEPTFFAADDVARMRWSPEVEQSIAQNRRDLQQYLDGPMDRKLDLGPVLEWENYLKLFRRANDQIAVGEGSVSYFWLPSAAAAISARIPDARIILVLRDPADRLFSHYLSGLWHHPDRSFRSQFLAGAAGGDWESALAVGRYHKHLRRFLDRFPSERVSIHRYEDYRSDPAGTLREIFAFLGVRPGQPVDFSRRLKQPLIPRYPRLHRLRQTLLKGIPPLSRWAPAPVRRAIAAVYQRPRRDVGMDPADRQMVIEFYRDEILGAADLIGRDLSAWLR